MKRDSEADSEAEVYDNIYTAISEASPSARDKRQNAVRNANQQNREGKAIHFVDSSNYDDDDEDGDDSDDLIMEPSIRHTSSIGYRQPPDEEDGFVPFDPTERFPRATSGTRAPSSTPSTPRIFEELVELISPPFVQQQPQQHNNNFGTSTNNFNTFSSNPFTTTNNPNQPFSSSFNNQQTFSNNNNNPFIQSTRPIQQSTTPFPQSFQATTAQPAFPTSAAATTFSQNLILNDQRSGKLRTGNGQPVKQSSRSPKSKKNKKNKTKGNNDSGNILFGVEINDAPAVVSEKRQGKQSSRVQQQQPPLTFLNPDLQTSPSSKSLSKLSGRQVNKIDGFPNGLPAQVPEGVRIALESAQRGNSKLHFNVQLNLWAVNFLYPSCSAKSAFATKSHNGASFYCSCIQNLLVIELKLITRFKLGRDARNLPLMYPRITPERVLIILAERGDRVVW